MPEGKGTDKCVYLNAQNWMADNSEAEAADDVPKTKLLYPRDEKESEDTSEGKDRAKEIQDADTKETAGEEKK